MLLKRIKTPGIAQISYVLAQDGTAAIIDPARDIDRYLKILRENGLRLRWVLETHRQEDFEMGGAELRRLTGAQIVACDHEIAMHADKRLPDGAEIALADGLVFRALHTPGHTPESMCYAVVISDAPDRAWGVFTGDALFIGDTGRTDLADPSQTADNAGLLYEQIHAKILPLGDQAIVLPAHGAGSACGGNVADRDQSTICMEKATNAAVTKSRAEFIRHKCAEQLAIPPYFRLMEEVNLQAGRPLHDRPVPWLSPSEFGRQSTSGIMIDTRPVEAFAGGHIPGSYSVWLEGVGRYGGWVTNDRFPICLVVEGPAALREAWLALARIGRDKVAGALAGGFASWRDAGHPIETIGTISARQLAEHRDHYAVVDVREYGEFARAGHIPGARHIHVGHLDAELARLRLDKNEPVVSTCSVGHRGSLGASILKRHGFTRVFNLLGGMTAWTKLELPVERTEGASHSVA